MLPLYTRLPPLLQAFGTLQVVTQERKSPHTLPEQTLFRARTSGFSEEQKKASQTLSCLLPGTFFSLQRKNALLYALRPTA
jgi:hypothetical protein